MTPQNQTEVKSPNLSPPMATAAQSDLAEALQAAPTASPEGVNLLRFRTVRALVLWAGFPYVFQALMLAVFVGLAVVSWNVFAPHGVNAKLYAKTNLATLLIWGVWWPAMVWLAVWLGRAWCMVCPLELVSNVSERLARRLRWPQRPLRQWIASGSIIVILYALIQMLVAGAHINRVQAYTSLFLWGLLGMAAVTGLVFKDRAFCRGFCPVGLLLGTYGRGGMLAVRAGGLGKCQGCTGRDCIRACNRTRLDARSCPSLLNPPKLNSSRDCLVCGQCIKSCERERLSNLWRRLALPLAVVIAIGHMSKGLAKFVSWTPFLPNALRDPSGVETLKALSAKVQAPPAPWMGLSSVAGVCLMLMAVALAYAIREFRLAQPGECTNPRAVFPVAALAVMFASIIVGWIAP